MINVKLIAGLGALVLMLPNAPRFPASVEAIRPNDNRIARGNHHGDTLEIHLQVRTATWRPEAETAPRSSRGIRRSGEGAPVPDL